MGSAGLQLLILAAIAVFLILKLRSVLGTREGFEAQAENKSLDSVFSDAIQRTQQNSPDRDIQDYANINSDTGKALAKMKVIEPEFTVSDFMSGAAAAYEMILMAFENDDRDILEEFLAQDVYEGFSEALDARADNGLKVEAEFIGLRDIKLISAEIDSDDRAQITLEFRCELTSVVHNFEGEIIEGSKTEIKRQKDIWSFERKMGSEDPNWRLVATDV